MSEEIPDLEDLGILRSVGDGPLAEGYRTERGRMLLATAEDLLDSDAGRELKGKVQLVFTSPPFPLIRKKQYGNLTGTAYREWIASLAKRLTDLLTPTGSLVIEIGNAWEPGRPVMSTLALRSLLDVLDEGDLHLCQQFICHNPARLPSPIQWVNVERIRAKDSFTHVWWMAPSERPKANNRNVLVPYSARMQRLLETGKYNSGRRPSGHVIGEDSFLRDNGGAIPPSVLQMSNTTSTTNYRRYCRENEIEAHPAPMQAELAEFFIKFLTDDDDLVLDPFAGSNTTGAAAEKLGRRWLSTEPNKQYVLGSRGRFDDIHKPNL